MIPFTRAIRPRDKRLTDDECDEIRAAFAINDARSERVSAADALSFQFHAHWFVNSGINAQGETVNHYGFDADGAFGVYPQAGAKSILMEEGRFLLEDGHLPTLAHVAVEITPDLERANENRPLTAFHRLFALTHNARMDVHDDFARARDETVAAFNKAFLHSALHILEMDAREFFEVEIKDFHRSIEFAMAVDRFGHCQMPETLNGKHLFDKIGWSSDVDMPALLTERAGMIGLRVSPPMNENSEGGKGRPILFHTITKRHAMHTIPTFQDAAKQLRIRSQVPFECCPLWAGILAEAREDRFGPVGRRLIADGIAGTLQWGRDQRKGCWYPEPDDVPTTLSDIIAEYWT